VSFQPCENKQGLTWANYKQGLDTWRRNKIIRRPWLGQDLSKYPGRELIGFSGMDLRIYDSLANGGRRKDREESARWGYAMYVTDNLRM
jgi:magnesium-dependent phosphatase 1